MTTVAQHRSAQGDYVYVRMKQRAKSQEARVEGTYHFCPQVPQGFADTHGRVGCISRVSCADHICATSP